MPGIRETRRLPYSCEEMFDLVADVGRSGEFLPWVVATRVRSDSETEMVADFVSPQVFQAYGAIARAKGFLQVASSPLTRSSYHAGDDFAQMKAAREAKLAKN